MRTPEAQFPDPREVAKTPALGGYRPHRCAICDRGFEVGQSFYSDAPNHVVHSACRFPKPASSAARAGG